MTQEERKRAWLQFHEVVNLDRRELEAWLETDESRAVGFKRAGRGESVGHASGRRIVRLLATPSGQLRDHDYRQCARSSGTCTGTLPSARAAT